MLTSISSSTIPHYPVVPKSPTPSLLSLPVEIQQEVESQLSSSSRQAFFEALTTVTRNGEPVDSPILKLHLLRQKVPSKYQQMLAKLDVSLPAFALHQLEILRKRGQLDQVVEKPALFELLRLVGDLTIFGFLKERIEEKPGLKQKLLNWIERSKTEGVQAIAANALTLLVKAGIDLSGQDFKGIRVPGADLSYGVLNHTQFEEADLSNVSFHDAQLRAANLQKANLAGVNFGEMPNFWLDSGINACCHSPDGRWLAFAECSNKIWLYSTESFEPVLVFERPSDRPGDEINSVSFSPDSQLLAAACENGTVKLWRAESGEKLQTFNGNSGQAYSVDFSPNGEVLAVGYGSGVKLWKVESGEELHTLEFHTPEGWRVTVHSVNFSPDGKLLALGCNDKRIRLWRVETREAFHILEGHNGGVTSVRFSPDGQLLASACYDGTVKLWSVESGEEFQTLNGDSGEAYSVDFSPNGEVLASGYQYGEVKLWKVKNGEKLHTFRAHTATASSVNFSPNGKFLVSASSNATAELWAMDDRKAGLYRASPESKLDVTNMSIQNVQGLSPRNKLLLKQKGALGEPTPMLRGDQSALVSSLAA